MPLVPCPRFAGSTPPTVRGRSLAALASCLAAVALAMAVSAPAQAAPAEPEPTSVTEHFAYSGQQESWTVPEGVTSITATVAGASGFDLAGNEAKTPRSGGAGGVVQTEVPVSPGTELLLLAGQHPAPDRGANPVFGNRPEDSLFPGGGGSFLATADEILVAAGGGGGGSRDWFSGAISADGGAGGFALGGPNGRDGGPDAIYAGGGATTTGPGTNGPASPTVQTPPASFAAHVAAGQIVPAFGGGSSVTSIGGGGGGYYGGGAGGEDLSPSGGAVGSGGGGSGHLADGLTALSTGANTGHGSITIEYAAPPTISGPDTAEATVGDPFGYTPTVTGAPAPTVTLTSGALPDGLALDPATGGITGTPQGDEGDYPVTLTAQAPGAPPARLDLTIRLSVVEFTVTFDANGHGTAPEVVTAPRGEPIAEPAAPTATGFTFTGWHIDAAATTAYDFAAPLTGDLTLYAGWEALSPGPAPAPDPEPQPEPDPDPEPQPEPEDETGTAQSDEPGSSTPGSDTARSGVPEASLAATGDGTTRLLTVGAGAASLFGLMLLVARRRMQTRDIRPGR